MRKKIVQNAGFTLVELLVVLAIVGIVAAMTVPAFTGYIQQQKEKSAIADCRQVVAAAQSLFMDKYTKNQVTSLGIDKTEVITFAGVNGKILGTPVFEGTVTTEIPKPSLKVTRLSYLSDESIGVKYDVTQAPHYILEEINTYTPLEEFIKSFQDVTRELVTDGTLGSWTGRNEVTKAFMATQPGGVLPEVDPWFYENKGFKMANPPFMDIEQLYWQPYYIATGKSGLMDSELTILFATPIDGSDPEKEIHNGWRTYLVYVNGSVYETNEPKGGTVIAKIGPSAKTEADVIKLLTDNNFKPQE